MCREDTNLQKLLGDIERDQISEDEKKKQFTFIIYDCIVFGQMGTKTSLTTEELQQRITRS